MRPLSRYIAFILLFAFAGRCRASAPDESNRVPSATSSISDDAHVVEVISRWLNVIGGMARLKTLRTIEIEHSVKISSMPLNRSISHSIQNSEGQYRVDLDLSGESLSFGFAGSRVWSADKFGFGYCYAGTPPPYFYWQQPALLALRLDKLFPRMTWLGETAVFERICSTIGMTDKRGLQQRWYFDKTTGNLSRIEGLYSGVDAITIDYSQFQIVSGVSLPFFVKQTIRTATVASTFLNVTVDGNFPLSTYEPSAQALRDDRKIQEILLRYESLVKKRTRSEFGRTRVTKSTVESIPLGLTSHVIIYQKGENLFLREENFPGQGTTITGTDGITAWERSDVRGFRMLKVSELADFMITVKPMIPDNLIAPFPRRALRIRSKLNGRWVDTISLSRFGQVSDLYSFDAETGLLVRLESDYIANPRGKIDLKIDYDDYRLVDGIEMPFIVAWTFPNKKIVMTCDSIQLDVPLRDKMFSPRK